MVVMWLNFHSKEVKMHQEADCQTLVLVDILRTQSPWVKSNISSYRDYIAGQVNPLYKI
jgi:hypothetical protein